MPRWSIALIPAAAAVAIAALWSLGTVLSAPANRAIGPAPASLGAESVRFASGSGSAVRGWLVRGEPGRGGIVLAHSVRSNRLEMVARAELLHRAGYAVLLFDQQAHGESAGERITFGLLESRDARAAVAFLRDRMSDAPIGYLGVSQGGAAALLGPEPLAVDALVLEAVYPTLREAVVNRIAIRLGPLADFLAPLLLLQIQPRLGVSPDALRPIEGIARIRAPLLLIAGGEDRHTTPADSRRLFEAAPEPKSLWIVPGAAHVDFERFDRAEYARRVLDFLARALIRIPK